MTTEQLRPNIEVIQLANDGRRRLIRVRDGDACQIHATMGGAESAAVAEALKLMARMPTADLSISERTLEEVEREPFCLDPDGIFGAARSLSISVLAPEGKPTGEDPNDLANRLWSDLWRSPWGSLSSSGRDGRFRERTLLDVVAARFSPDRQRPQVIYKTETLIRRDWRVRDLAPLAWEPDQPTPRTKPSDAEEQAQALVAAAAFAMRLT